MKQADLAVRRIWHEEMKLRHDNMYCELAQDKCKTMDDIDPYEMSDRLLYHTGDRESDIMDTFQTTYDNGHGKLNMYKAMEDFIGYCTDVDIDDLTKEQTEVLDKACVAYASSFSKKGGPFADVATIGSTTDKYQETLSLVMQRLDAVSDGDFTKSQNDNLAKLNTGNDLRRIFSYSEKLLDKYDDLKNADSVRYYVEGIKSYNNEKNNSRTADDLVANISNNKTTQMECP